MTILVNFNDATLATDCTTTKVNGILFSDANSLNNYYKETSFNALSFTGDVIGPYNIDFNSISSCTSTTWNTLTSLANSAATNAGYNLADYNHIIYVMPSSCNGGSSMAKADLGGNRVWNMGRCSTKGTYLHEIGHNLNMHHASSVPGECKTTTSSNCNEYGDISDVMGDHYVGGLMQVNNPHKYQMEWIPLNKFISPASGINIYEIAAIELNPSQTTLYQGIKLPGNYYLSYRKPIGFDSTLNSYYLNKANIHNYTGGNAKTFFVKGILDNGIFNHPSGLFSVKQLSHTADSVRVEVSITTGCTRVAPSLTISPSSQTGFAGNSLIYNINILNNDNSLCGATTFSLNSQVPSGWSSSFSQNSFSLSPGQSGSASFTITSVSTASAGNYNFDIISSGSSATHSVSKTATYTVNVPDTTAPSAPGNLQGSADKFGRVKLSWTASSDNVAISGYKIFRNGIEIAFTSSLLYTDASADLSQPVKYYVIAVDSSNNLSPQSNEITVSQGTSTTGKGRKR